MALRVTMVYCKTRFISFHRWQDAPDEFVHLRHSHRHEFHVQVWVNVHHTDRQVEFQKLKKHVDSICATDIVAPYEAPVGFSCEDMCVIITGKLRDCAYDVAAVDVSEDGENGATVVYE